MTSSSERASSKPIEVRSKRWQMAFLVVLAGLVGFFLGVVLADGDVGQPPAIDMAREAGLALPIEQQPAFANGVITRPEVEQAIERLTTCAEAAGVTGFVAAVSDEGTDIHMEHSGGNRNAVELCRLKHFQATYTVWSQQERLDN